MIGSLRAPVYRRVMLTVAFLLLGCAGRSGPDRPHVDRGLNGLWTGKFRNDANREGGTIRIRVLGGVDSTYGYLVLGDSRPRESCDTLPPEYVDGNLVLRFRTLAISATGVAGWVEGFHDLTLGCRVDTWFEGSLSGDSLTGAYYARPATGGRIAIGRWWAVRRE